METPRLLGAGECGVARHLERHDEDRALFARDVLA